MKGPRRTVVAGVALLLLGGCSSPDNQAPPSVATQVETVTASLPTTPSPTGPMLGAPCIGADAGLTAIDPNGVGIVCDEYRWRENVGQTPGHSWADDQAAWAECIASHTVEECREMLHR